MSPPRKTLDGKEPLPPHLQQRGKRYYFRIAVPKDLLHLFPKEQELIRISLRTNIRRTADERFQYFERLADKNFARLRQPNLHPEEIASLVTELLPRQQQQQAQRQKPRFNTLEDILAEYQIIHDHKNCTKKTQQEYDSSYKMLFKHFSNKPLAMITNDDCIEYRNFLIRSHEASAADKLAKQIAKIQKSKNPNATPRKPAGNPNTTINKHLTKLFSLLELAVTKDVIHRNPAKAIYLEAEKTSYLQFSDQDIQKIVDVLPLPDSNKNWKPSWLWVPLITMFTGARKNEVCQLYKADILDLNGIKCFHFSDEIYTDDDFENDDKRIKTDAAKYVPIHSNLIELGFLDFVKSVTTPRLFPELNLHRDGFGHSFKWFDRHFPIRHNRKVPSHSFRHTVSNRMNDAGIVLAHRADILGHEKGSITTNSDYTDRTLISVLKYAIETVKYDVDFSRLMPQKLLASSLHRPHVRKILKTWLDEPAESIPANPEGEN